MNLFYLKIYHPGFVKYNRKFKDLDLTVFNYNFPNFPDIDDPYYKALIEMRGLHFINETGEILSRPFHKFFNINERPETNVDTLNFENSNIVEKFDGSMIQISSFKNSDQLFIGTKMGSETEVAKLAQKMIGSKLDDLLIEDKENTHMFEFCSDENQIVIYHEEPKLVYLGSRNKISGEYNQSLRSDISNVNLNIELLKPLDVNLTEVKTKWKNREGVIVSWPNGNKVKMKTEDYLRKHSNVFISNNPKKMLLLSINNEVDDFKSIHSDNKNSVDKVTSIDVKYQKYLNEEINDLLDTFHINEHLKNDRKNYALSVINHRNSDILFKMLNDEYTLVEIVRDMREKHRIHVNEVVEKLGL